MAITLTSVPDEIARSRTPLWFVAESDAVGLVKIRFELYRHVDNVLIFKTVNLQVDVDGKASYNFSKVITDQMGKNVPVLGGGLPGNADADAVFKYYVKAVNIVDGVATLTANSTTHYAIFGDHSFFLKEPTYLPVDTEKTYLWLTAKPLEREIYQRQEEIATVLFTADIAAPVLNTSVFFTDGTAATVLTDLEAAIKASVRNFDFSFKEQVWNEFSDPAKEVSRIEIKITGAGVTGDTIIYKVQLARSAEMRSYIFRNKRGGFDSFAATGNLAEKEDIKGEVYLIDKKYTGIKQQPEVVVYNQNSGWIPKSEAGAYAQMRRVNNVWLVLDSGELVSITIQPDSTDMPDDVQNINAFTIAYTFGDGRQDFETINAIKMRPINISDVENLEEILANKVDRYSPMELTNAASVSLDCVGKQISLFTYLDSSYADCDVMISNLPDGGSAVIKPLKMVSMANYKFTFLHADDSVIVQGTGGATLTISNSDAANRYEISILRSGGFIYIKSTLI